MHDIKLFEVRNWPWENNWFWNRSFHLVHTLLFSYIDYIVSLYVNVTSSSYHDCTNKNGIYETPYISNNTFAIETNWVYWLLVHRLCFYFKKKKKKIIQKLHILLLSKIFLFPYYNYIIPYLNTLLEINISLVIHFFFSYLSMTSWYDTFQSDLQKKNERNSHINNILLSIIRMDKIETKKKFHIKWNSITTWIRINRNYVVIEIQSTRIRSNPTTKYNGISGRRTHSKNIKSHVFISCRTTFEISRNEVTCNIVHVATHRNRVKTFVGIIG